MNKTITLEQANKIISNLEPLNEIITIDLLESSGFILAEDIKSDISSPPFNKSAMDGYAFSYLEDGLYNEKEALFINTDKAIIQAGDFRNFNGDDDKSFEKEKKNIYRCIKIMTGAKVPAWADTVIMVEDTLEVKENNVSFTRIPKKGSNVCLLGEDYTEDTILIKNGTEITYRVISVLAAAGIAEVKVFRKPRIALFSTGDEIVEYYEKPGTSQIRNSSAPSLMAQLKTSFNIDVTEYKIIKDSKQLLKDTIVDLVEKNDLVIFTGGASVGDYDYTEEVLDDLNAETYFSSTKIKPGKPAIFSKVGDKGYVFNLPGNPVSTMFLFEVYIKQIIKKLSNFSDYKIKFYTGILVQDVKHRNNRVNFINSTVEYKDNKYFITPVKTNGSADILSYAKANCMIKLFPEEHIKKAGEVVEFIFV